MHIYGHVHPSERDDYIFYCHPVEQRVPTPSLLQKWYKTMLDIAVQRRVVVNYTVGLRLLSTRLI